MIINKLVIYPCDLGTLLFIDILGRQEKAVRLKMSLIAGYVLQKIRFDSLTPKSRSRTLSLKADSVISMWLIFYLEQDNKTNKIQV